MTFTRLSDGTVILRAKTKSIMDMAGSLKREGYSAIPANQMTPWK
jgi:hypothetical protein